MTDFTKGPPPEGFDPYRYGAPPPPPTGRRGPTGKQILTSSWRLLKQDRELIALPLLGAFFGAIAFLLLFSPGLVIAISSHGHNRVPIYLFAVLGGFAATIVSIFFQAALVIGAYQRADGMNPTFGGTLAGAARLWRPILGWALLSTVVGTVVRAVEQRLGIVGKILGFLAGLAWAVATYFVVPVLVAEGLGPIDAVKRSSEIIRKTWGTSVRTTLRFGLIGLVVVLGPVIVGAIGFAAVANGGTAGVGVGVTLIVLAVLALIGASVVLGSVSTYARALIYRWTTGRPVPGIDPALFAGAFAPRRGRR